MNKFSIRDIENLTGIKAHTIRIWEQRYDILKPQRTDTNIRYYNAEDLKLALNISLLNNYGYKISRIHHMSAAEMAAAIEQINDKQFKTLALVNNLLEATLNIDMVDFEQLLDKYTKEYGIEATVEDLIFKFLEKLGAMWMTNHIFPAQEHLVTNIIYRKLSAAIEHMPERSKKVSIVLYLPEGEIHDIGLLYMYYFLQKHGKNPLYLGANTPFSEVQFIVEKKKPTHLYMHLTSPANDFDLARYLKQAVASFRGINLYVSGRILKHKKHPQLPGVHYFHNMEEAKEFLIKI